MTQYTPEENRRTASPQPQAKMKHPPQYQEDMNPHQQESQNLPLYNIADDPRAHTAATVKPARQIISQFSRQEQREIPVVPPETQLKEGAIYLDLVNPERGPFTAHNGQVASAENLYVPKAETPYPYWNRLVGIEDPNRL